MKKGLDTNSLPKSSVMSMPASAVKSKTSMHIKKQTNRANGNFKMKKNKTC